MKPKTNSEKQDLLLNKVSLMARAQGFGSPEAHVAGQAYSPAFYPPAFAAPFAPYGGSRGSALPESLFAGHNIHGPSYGSGFPGSMNTGQPTPLYAMGAPAAGDGQGCPFYDGRDPNQASSQ